MSAWGHDNRSIQMRYKHSNAIHVNKGLQMCYKHSNVIHSTNEGSDSEPQSLRPIMKPLFVCRRIFQT
eukprot:1151581-Pelagomonas_calceolata.AAC.2